MSVVKTKKKIICDICGEEIKKPIWWYSLKWCCEYKRVKMHLCEGCWQDLIKAVKEMKVE